MPVALRKGTFRQQLVVNREVPEPKVAESSINNPRTFTMILHIYRGVAQLASAPRLGRGGRRFESSHPDH